MDVPDLLATRIHRGHPLDATTDIVATPNRSMIFGPAPTTPNQTTTATGDASHLDTPIGHWEHPALKQLEQERRSSEALSRTRRRFRVNVAFLLLFIAITNIGYYRTVVSFVSWIIPGLGTLISYGEWLVYLIFGANITDAWIRWVRPQSAYSALPLTKYQRQLLGLPELTASKEEAAAVITPPRYQSIANGLRQSMTTTPAGLPQRRQPLPTATTTPFGTVPRHLFGTAAAAATTTTPLNSPPPAPPLFFGRNGQVMPQRHDRSTFGDISGQPMTEASDIDALLDNNDPTLNLSMLSRNSVTNQSNTSALNLGGFPFVSGLGLPATQGPPPISTFAYQEALPIVKRNLTTATVEQALDGLGYKDPQTVLDELGVDLYVDTWTENLRMWLSSHVLKHVMELMSEVEQTMQQQGISHLDARKAQLPVSDYPAIVAALDPTSATTTTTTTTAGTMGMGMGMGRPLGFGQPAGFGLAASTQPQQPPQTLIELVQRYPRIPLTRKRIELERYLNMPGFTCRDYIISRIKDLAVGGVLGAYRWDSGALVWDNDKKWTTEMPCDAQLILHLFCTFLDLVTPDNDATFPMNVPFSSVHYLAEGAKPDANVAIQLKQVKKYPPHYCLVVDNKCWDIYPKRNNLFHTLVLFTFYANTKCAGYLGLLKLASKSVGLSDVVAE